MASKLTVFLRHLTKRLFSGPLRRFPAIPLLYIIPAIVFLAGYSYGVRPPGSPTPAAGAPAASVAEVEKALAESIDQAEDVLGYQIFDVAIEDVQFSKDTRWATARLIFRDRTTHRTIPTEPGLAVAHLEDGAWVAYLPSSPGWDSAVSQLPDELISDEAKVSWLAQFSANNEASDLGPFTGYLLPWAGGEQKYLTRSITHGIGGSSHYAFDFAQPGYPSSMFPVYASKSGWVEYVVWSYPNGYDDGNCNHQNYLVTKHPDTVPPSYTMYIHLAQDSIPLELRIPGAFVLQGQLIGMADDTGCSSGNHLHIQTHTNPYSYWGNSVDMVFSDVPINGGRPRTPDEASEYPEYGSQGQHLYTSGNTVQTDVTPPQGEIYSPHTGETVESPILPVAGSVSDSGSGISQFKLVYASSGAWNDASGLLSGSWFSEELDICSTAAPDGPLSLALQIWDQAGNSAFPEGITHLNKDFSCPTPPPACIPGPDQAAIYAEPLLQGSCSIFNQGEYTSTALGEVGPDNAASILLGETSVVTLFSEDAFEGRSGTIAAADLNLGENSVQADTLESMIVASSGAPPAVPAPVWPAPGAQFSTSDSLDFAWRDAGGGLEYEFRILGQVSETYPWRKDPFVSTGSLPPGVYTWQVRSKNPAGTSEWSQPGGFEILPDPTPPPPVFPVPYSEGFETGIPGWAAGGLWHITSAQGMAHSGASSAWYADPATGTYQTGGPNAGDLTSPSISISGAGYTLEFWYLYGTEGRESPWDARWVQVSVNGGSFENLYRLGDDEPGVWLKSPALALDDFAGDSIKVRFHFTSIDGELNSFLGWAIDDISISQQTSPDCLDSGEPNDGPASATEISFGADLTAQVCPAGDLDLFKFSGSQGDRIFIDIDAEISGSALDSFVFLLASDGTSVLASNDDEVLYTRHDSQLGFNLPESGPYYIKVRAWDHPGAGSAAHSYRLRLGLDGGDPELTLSSPPSNSYLPEGSTTLSATAGDSDSEIGHVEFLWHDYDWTDAGWSVLSDDWESADGWSTAFDSDNHPEGRGLAFFARAYDLAGNVSGEGTWEIGIDRTPPVSAILALPPTHASTAAWIPWSASDNVSGLESFDLQVSVDAGAWQDDAINISGYAQGYWSIGEPGQLVDFRMRAEDLAGNLEAFPAGPEATTFLLPCSAPDPWEQDGTAAEASAVSPGETPQAHNFCIPADQDWLRLDTGGVDHFRIFALPASPDSAARIEVFHPDGTTLLASASASGFGQFLQAEFTAPAAGSYYIRLTHIHPQVAGDGVAYHAWVEEGYETFLPAVLHP